MQFIVIGNIGSDAGYWVWENGHLVHHGGWGVESLAQVSSGLGILSQATQLKSPGLADEVSQRVGAMVEKELAAHLGDRIKGGVVVVNVQAN